MATRSEILARLDIPGLLRELLPDAKPSGNNKLVGHCPWPESHKHGDASPSFLVFPADGSFKCLGCNEKGSIFDLYGKVRGLAFKDAISQLELRAGLKTPRLRRKVTGSYVYHDSDGLPLYWKERVEPGNYGRTKAFCFYHGIGVEPGQAYYLPAGKQKSLLGRGCDPVLYRLPEVLKATLVIIVEGEKQADLLHFWGLTATSLDSGCQSKLTQAMIDQLSGKHIVILPDNDPPGRMYAERIASALVGKAASVKVLELPELPDKGDIVDWAATPLHDLNLLLNLIEQCNVWISKEQAMTPASCSNAEAEAHRSKTASSAKRAYPRLYLDLELLLNDPRRYNFERGIAPMYDSLVLRIARSPGAQFPNNPRAVAHVLEIPEDIARKLIDIALQSGMLVLNDEGYLTHPMVTEQYNKALAKCKINAENGAKGGQSNPPKSRRKTRAKRSLGD